jgi:SOS-response transcriptional repressor LexA
VTDELRISSRSASVLEQYARYYAQSHSSVAPKQALIARQLYVSPPTVSMAVSELHVAGLMTEEGDSITPAGYEYLRSHRVLVSALIPIAGRVQAGPSEMDTLAILIENYRELEYTEGPCLCIPDIRDVGHTVALEVRGHSMEEVNIFEGDYVIVDLFDKEKGEGPRESDLIIARYMPVAGVRDWFEGEVSDYLWEGPTVKYYFRNGQRHWLSPRKHLRSKRGVIEAVHVDPVGRVVGAHRRLD